MKVTGILLVTHNGLGDSLLSCVQHVLGSVPANVMVLAIQSKDDPQRKEDEGRAVIAHLDTGSGVLLLADMFGATPSNIGRKLCQLPNVLGVAGLNLPMLLRAVYNQSKPLQELAQMALEGGRECIVPINSSVDESCNAATGSSD
jgi:PTS system mannose-specific IIA component